MAEAARGDASRRRREATATAREPRDPEPVQDEDDTLAMLVLCCHPALTAASQVALTLRAVGGLTTAEIARAFLVPDATIGQRISRAKKSITAAGGGFGVPGPEAVAERLGAVLHVLYLVFNEGYVASSGASLHRAELSAEAIRLARQLHARLPDDGEVAGLLALMLLTDARRRARTAPDGGLIPLAEQDRGRWDAGAIAEGVALVSDALARAPIGPNQVQAAIAALHDEAPTADATDWRQILALYEVLSGLAPGPMVTLNRIVALAMVEGPEAGLAALSAAAEEPALAAHHRFHAVRAHLLEQAGEADAAEDAYHRAARATLSLPERRYLEGRAIRLAQPTASPADGIVE
jgi:predicted RNA polymerase sigma factor